MQFWYTKGGTAVLQDRFPVTSERFCAMIGPTPVSYRVQDRHTNEWREPWSDERAHIRAWLWRFGQKRGCSPIGTHPVARVGVVFFLPISN
jgi:hypothetical protein